MRPLIIFTVMMLLLTPSVIFPHVWGNEGEGGGEKAPLMESYIVDSASAFLKAQSDMFLLLNEAELSLKNGFNVTRMQDLIGQVCRHLDGTKQNLESLISLMNITVFDEFRILKLKKFDFQKFAKQKNLHEKIMDSVAFYLSTGNVTGVYQFMLDKVKDFMKKMEQLKNKPENIKKIKKRLQEFNDLLLFGFYASLVFAEAK